MPDEVPHPKNLIALLRDIPNDTAPDLDMLVELAEADRPADMQPLDKHFEDSSIEVLRMSKDAIQPLELLQRQGINPDQARIALTPVPGMRQWTPAYSCIARTDGTLYIRMLGDHPVQTQGDYFAMHRDAFLDDENDVATNYECIRKLNEAGVPFTVRAKASMEKYLANVAKHALTDATANLRLLVSLLTASPKVEHRPDLKIMEILRDAPPEIFRLLGVEPDSV